MTDVWREYVDRMRGEGSLLRHAVDHWCYHRSVYGSILRYAPPPGRLLEIGCGLGLSAIYLQACGYRVTGVDQDAGIVGRARSTAADFRSEADFREGSAADLSVFHGAFDLVYSIGVVEHFTPDVTVDLLREQARCAPLVLAVIPTRRSGLQVDVFTVFHGYRGFRGLMRRAGLEVVSAYTYGDPAGSYWPKLLLPRWAYRLLQNEAGYSLTMAFLGRRRG